MLGGGGGGAIGQFPLEQWFYEMPICTRWWTVATVTTSILVQCHIITPFQLFYSFRAVFVKSQVSITMMMSVPCTFAFESKALWNLMGIHADTTTVV